MADDRTTDALIAEIEQALENITPGDWELVTANGRLRPVREQRRPHGEASTYEATVRVGEFGASVCKLDFGYGQNTDTANAEFIAAAPRRLRAALSVLQTQRDVLTRLELIARCWREYQQHAGSSGAAFEDLLGQLEVVLASPGTAPSALTPDPGSASEPPEGQR